MTTRPIQLSKTHLVTTLGLILVAWLVLSWFTAQSVTESKFAELVLHEATAVESQTEKVASNIGSHLSYLHGIPFFIAANQDVIQAATRFPVARSNDPGQRKSAWSAEASLKSLNQQLDLASKTLGVDVAWVMNSAGDCIASSNSDTPQSFVGSNYADRDYFQMAMAGNAGYQYAMGKTSNVAGLYFSAPVRTSGRIIGSVQIKINLSKLAAWTNQANAFIADRYGVIIFAEDPRLAMHTLSNATLYRLSEEQLQARYKRTHFPPLALAPWATPSGPALFGLAGEDVPTLMAHRELENNGITVHVLRRLVAFSEFNQQRLHFFLLLAALGSTLIVVIGGHLIITRLRKLAALEMEHSLSLLHATLESTSDSLLVVNQSGRITTYNQRFVALWRIPPALLTSRDDQKLLAYVLDQLTDPREFLDKVQELYTQPEQSSHDRLHFKDGRLIERDSYPQRQGSEVVGRVWNFRDVTEQRRAQWQLERLIAEQKAVLENDLISIVKVKDRIVLWANPAYEKMLGYTQGELTGTPTRQTFPSTASYEAMGNAAYPILSAGGIYRAQIEQVRKDGRQLWVELSGVMLDSNNGVSLWELIDVTEQKRNVKALSEAEYLYRSLADNIPTLIWKAGTDKLCNFFNQPWLQFTGRTLEQELGNGWTEGIHPDDFARCMQSHIGAFESREPFSIEYRLRHADNTYHWILNDGRPTFDSQGNFTGYIGGCTDITERKQAETNLHLAASVFKHAREGIMITDAEGTIIDVNEMFSVITGYSRDEVLGRNPRLLKSGLHNQEFYAACWREMTEKGHWSGEIWNRRKNGELFAEMQMVSAVRNNQGQVQHYVSLFSDITPLKEHQQQLEHIAHFDALTGLPNRVLLGDRLHQAMALSLRHRQKLAVAYLDLDGFKAVNDEHGHDAGDHLLVTVATRMKQSLRDGDTLARLGGDEFVAVLADLSNVTACAPIFNRLLEAAAQPVQFGQSVLQVSASVGVTFYPQADEIDADQLLRQADQAMYQAKLAGKNRYHLFDAEQDRSVRGHHESLGRIQQALQHGEFVLHYQPRVNMRLGTVTSAEALIRWQHPERGLLPPADFLPMIETHALSADLGEWVIDSALQQMQDWHLAGLDLPISVNVSAQQLLQGDFIDRLRAALAAHPDVNPHRLELEVLETSALADIAHVSRLMHACQEIGISFSLDDFGTGYSSLTYLKMLPAGLLKIDQSFVHDMLDVPADLAIIEGVLGLARAFSRQVVAEGVETVEQGKMLLQLGCELAQGYVIARPMPARELPAWLSAWRNKTAWNDITAVSRDDLPLLFAGAEHRAWIRGIEAFLAGDQTTLPSLDDHQCRFGLWLEHEGLRRYGSALQAITSIHHQVHVLATEILELHAQHRTAEALARLHALRDSLLDQLNKLLNERRG